MDGDYSTKRRPEYGWEKVGQNEDQNTAAAAAVVHRLKRGRRWHGDEKVQILEVIFCSRNAKAPREVGYRPLQDATLLL